MPSVGTASAGLAAVTKTAAWTATPGSFVSANALSGGFTVTLPASPGNGVTVGVKKTDSSTNVVTVVSGTSATIDGDTSTTLTAQGVGAIFVFDGTNWQIYSTAVTNAAVSSGTSSSSGSGSSDLMFAPNYTSGYWYDRRYGTATPYQAGSYCGITANTVTYIPQFLHKSVTINAVALMLGSTPGGQSVRIGAYAPLPSTGLPGTLVTNGDFGLLGLGTTGSALLVQTLATNCTLPKGYIYWAISVGSSALGSSSLSGMGPNSAPFGAVVTVGVPDSSFTFSNVGNGNPYVFPTLMTAVGDASASALASTTSPSTVSYTTGTILPNVFFRIA